MPGGIRRDTAPMPFEERAQQCIIFDLGRKSIVLPTFPPCRCRTAFPAVPQTPFHCLKRLILAHPHPAFAVKRNTMKDERLTRGDRRLCVRPLDGIEQFGVLLVSRQLRMVGLDSVGALEQDPALLACIMPRSLKLSPAAMVSNPHDCRARTVVSLESLQRILKPAISPSGVMASSLQKMVGQPSFSIRGLANWVNVSLMMITWVNARSSSRTLAPPGSGSICAIVS